VYIVYIINPHYNQYKTSHSTVNHTPAHIPIAHHLAYAKSAVTSPYLTPPTLSSNLKLALNTLISIVKCNPSYSTSLLFLPLVYASFGTAVKSLFSLHTVVTSGVMCVGGISKSQQTSSSTRIREWYGSKVI